MKRISKFFALLLLILATANAAAAGRAPIIDLSAQTARRADGNPAEVADIAKAFRAAGGSLGWTFAEEGPAHLVGTVVVRGKHTVVVDIFLRRGEYDVKYRSSVNMRYREEDADDTGKPAENQPQQPSLASKKVRTIHSSYNSWVMNLIHGVTGELLR
ncbi:hypothetical protein BURK2_02005 [Burkholderiales bacterium]|nr:MAG: hypothetical protein F9K47_07300 [Burkholderiales bacterium]CAG0983981.1 hypothetical protein BURK2_02005 [Burkholderiales bacterium]